MRVVHIIALAGFVKFAFYQYRQNFKGISAFTASYIVPLCGTSGLPVSIL